jgi:hypothetical protein
MGKILEAIVEPFAACFVSAAHTRKPRQSGTKRTSLQHWVELRRAKWVMLPVTSPPEAAA